MQVCCSSTKIVCISKESVTASFRHENSLVSVANDKRTGGKRQIRALAEAGGVV